MLRRQDVGHRVVVRRIVGVSQDRPLFSDALGELVELTETELTIATDKGTLRVPLREVHRAKRVPAARRPPAAEVMALELAANDAWPAPTQARLGDWILRAAGNWTGRAQLGARGRRPRPHPRARPSTPSSGWYAEHGQQPLINAPMPLAAPVNAALDERGWTSRPLTLVQTARIAPLLAGLEARPDLPPVELADAPSDDWFAMVAEHKGTLPAAAVRILTGAGRGRLRPRARHRRRADRGGPRRGDRPRPLARRLAAADRPGRPAPRGGPARAARASPSGRPSAAAAGPTCRSRSATRRRSRCTARPASSPTTPT